MICLIIGSSILAVMVLLGLCGRRSNRFYNAVTCGQLELVTEMLAARPELAQQTDAIIWAVRSNQRGICEVLLQHGCDMTTKTHELLCTAVSHPEMLRFVLGRGLDVKRCLNSPSPLHIAAVQGCLESAQILVEHGANLEARFERWQNATPLVCAARRGHVELVKHLLALGADPFTVDVTHRLRPLKGGAFPPEDLRACEECIRTAQQSRLAS